MKQLRVNGIAMPVDADADTPLLWVLRDHLGLTGTKFGCGIGVCGSCTVHIDGRAVRSCSVTLSGVAEAAEITTVEGFSGDLQRALTQAWIDEQVPQCGYCQPGMIMAVAAFLDEHPHPNDSEIARGVTNLCRCGTYSRIRRAIRRVAEGRSMPRADA